MLLVPTMPKGVPAGSAAWTVPSFGSHGSTGGSAAPCTALHGTSARGHASLYAGSFFTSTRPHGPAGSRPRAHVETRIDCGQRARAVEQGRGARRPHDEQVAAGRTARVRELAHARAARADGRGLVVTERERCDRPQPFGVNGMRNGYAKPAPTVRAISGLSASRAG